MIHKHQGSPHGVPSSAWPVVNCGSLDPSAFASWRSGASARGEGTSCTELGINLTLRLGLLDLADWQDAGRQRFHTQDCKPHSPVAAPVSALSQVDLQKWVDYRW